MPYLIGLLFFNRSYTMKMIFGVILLAMVGLFTVSSFAQTTKEKMPMPINAQPKDNIKPIQKSGPFQMSLHDATLATVNCLDRELVVRDARHNQEFLIFFNKINGNAAKNSAEQTRICNAANLHAGQRINVSGSFIISNGQKIIHNAALTIR